MKKTLITLMSLAVSVASAADYVWTGNANDNKWESSNNWNLNNGYYPQSSQDSAVIGSQTNPLTINWKEDYIGDTKSISLGENVTVVIDYNGGQKEFNTLTSVSLAGNSKLYMTNGESVGLGQDVTVDYGTFGYGDSGLLEYTGLGKLWGNKKTYTLTGTLDASTFASVAAGETVTFDLVKMDLGGADNDMKTIYFNTDGITLVGGASIVEVTDGTTRGIQISYTAPTAPVPEPATATLSLLALAGLATRRRRK